LQSLRNIVASYRERIPSKEELYQLYEVRHMSVEEIRQYYQSGSTGTVFGWLRKYGIERRSMSDAVRQSWVKRHKKEQQHAL
jgi:hypothetical protein